MKAESPASWLFFGAPEFHRPDGEWVEGIGRKPAALLALAVYAADGVSRTAAAEMLWPEAAQPRALHSLRQALLSLRKAFGDAFDDLVDVSTDAIRVKPGVVETDVGLFLDLAGSGDLKSWVQAAELYRDDYLAAFRGVSEPFDHWAAARRDQLAAAASPLFERLEQLALKRGALPEAERYRALKKRTAERTLPADAAEFMAPTPAAAEPPTPSARQRRRRRRLLIALPAALALAFAGLVILRQFDVLPQPMRDFVDAVREKIWPRETPSIAVAPFDIRGDDEMARALADGLTQGVTYALHAVTANELFVVNAPEAVVGRGVSARVTRAREAGIDYLILGSVETVNGEVRVEARLLDTRSVKYVWSDRFDRPQGEIFELEDDLTLQIISNLDIDLSTAERNRIRLIDDTHSLEAWLAAGNGLRSLIKVTRADNRKAQIFYREALEHDPGYVSALRGLAWTHFLDARLGWSESPQISVAKAVELSQQVLARSPEDGTTHSLLGAVKLLQNDFEGAIQSGEKAIELLPNSADATAVLAHTLTYVGESDRALELLDRAMRLSPKHPDWYVWAKGRALRLSGRPAEAIGVLEARMRGRPPAIAPLIELIACYSATGQIEKARQIAARIQMQIPHFSTAIWLEHPRLQDPDEQEEEVDLLVAGGLPE